MRFPNDTMPPATAPVDATELSQPTAVRAVRRVGEGTRAALVQVGGGPVPAVTEREERPRELEDRRKMCRRIYHVPVLLDTRSGEERRRSERRELDEVTHIDQEI
jgi:hypothetical protein